MRIRIAAPHPAASSGPPTPPPQPPVLPGDIQDILAQLKARTKAATQMIRKQKARIRSKPRRVLLFAALPVLAVGIAWSIHKAASPEPPAAPVLAPNATVSVMRAPAEAPQRQSLQHDPVLRIQPKSALEQARMFFPDDGKSIALKFKPVSEFKFREPESYIVLFNVPARQDLLDDWKAHGIVLVENYGPLVSVFWAPSEAALKDMGEAGVQVCPLSMAAKNAASKPAVPAKGDAKN